MKSTHEKGNTFLSSIEKTQPAQKNETAISTESRSVGAASGGVGPSNPFRQRKTLLFSLGGVAALLLVGLIVGGVFLFLAHQVPTSRPNFSGKVLHWTESRYQTADASNKTLVEFLLKLGPDGKVNYFQERLTLPAGDAQEIIKTQTQTVLITDRHTDGPVCHTVSAPSPTQQPLKAPTPPFALESELTKAGYKKFDSHFTSPLPKTADLKGATPSTVYTSDASAQLWGKTDRVKNKAGKFLGTVLKEEYTDGQARVVGAHLKTVTAAGKVETDRWQVYGPLNVYDATSVPSATFAVPAPQTSQDPACN